MEPTEKSQNLSPFELYLMNYQGQPDQTWRASESYSDTYSV